jgi:tRNA U34 2-thiouridine synthase MnmA/TrmU
VLARGRQARLKKTIFPTAALPKKLVVALAAINSEQALSLWRLSYLPKNKKSS